MSAQELTDTQVAEIEKAAPWLAKTCGKLLRQSPDALGAYLNTICSRTALKDTKASVHCHFVAHDGNGRPRVPDLAKAVAERLVDYCIPRSEFDKAKHSLIKTNSSREWVGLERKAKELFTELAKSGEGGEILLYLLVESMLGIPQLLCKMPLKTSGHVHYHGVDGIHGAVDETTGLLALYWGESKLHAKINQAIRECFKSVSPFLLESGGTSAAHSRDLHLLRDNLDLHDEKLEAAIQKYLNPDDPAYRKLQFRAACLVGFDCDAYPTVPNTKIEAAVRSEIESALDVWKTKLQTQVSKQKLETFTIEVFCLPFPTVDKFRRAFRAELGIR
jgi:hypothetical protein